jgi:hypothetical protein
MEIMSNINNAKWDIMSKGKKSKLTFKNVKIFKFSSMQKLMFFTLPFVLLSTFFNAMFFRVAVFY